MSQLSAPTEHTSLGELYDLAALRRYACQVARIQATAAPGLEVSTPITRRVETAPLLVLPGSYNPPTNAHLALARASLEANPQASLFLALGTTTINKEGIERATLVDRLALLDQIIQRAGRMGVFLTNQGLYVGQARAIRAAFPRTGELVFVVGYDKIEQIFDARYYQDRDAALTELFALATFLVAPRADYGAADVAALLSQPENQQFQAKVRVLPLSVKYREVSSSQIRAAFQTPQAERAADSLATLLPPEALAFALETGCYTPPEPLANGEMIDRYSLRATLIDRAMALPEAAQAALDLQRLFCLATSATAQGHALRCWLREPAAASPYNLLRF